jgi:hypothetical protein
MKKYYFILLLLFTGILITQAQDNVGIGTTTPHNSAVLDINSNNKGLLVPRLTQAERENINNPAVGLLVYQTNNLKGFYYYTPTGWKIFAMGNLAVITDSINITQNYTFTGTVQTFVVPNGVTKVTITAKGAEGGFGVIHQPNVAIEYPAGGLGGTVTGTFNVTAGDTLFIYVGAKPSTPFDNVTTNSMITGGWNGGGNGIAEFTGGIYYIPGGGGGATDVRLNGNLLSNRIIVAGGGGGSTKRTFAGTNFTGGNGGGINGTNGICDNGGCGIGGTQTGGNALGLGGNGTTPATGGGGGGYWGGTGGTQTDAAGGGGSGYVDANATNTSFITGNNTGHGMVTISATKFITDTTLFTQYQYALNKLRITPEDSNNWGAVDIGSVNSTHRLVAGVYNNQAAVGAFNKNNNTWGTLNINPEGNVKINGKVGIGGEPSAYPLEVNSVHQIMLPGGIGWHYLVSGATPIHTPTYPNISIKTSGNILSAGYYTTSDKRIKKNINALNASQSLHILQQLKVVEYELVDSLFISKQKTPGLIAQEVAKVYPDASTVQNNFIPNIYTLSSYTVYNPLTQSVRIKLNKQHGLAIKDIIKIIDADEIKETEIINIIDTTTFEINWSGSVGKLPSQQMFIYGKKVTDFGSVDYNKIFMLGINAIQELHKQNEALKLQLYLIEKRINHLERNKINQSRKFAHK